MAAAQATTVLGDADFPAEWGDAVPDEAFKDRLDVAKVELPSRIKKIGSYAFENCSNLEECTVPPDVVVDENAFADCERLRGATMLGDTDFPAE